jgi:hypothetical protein
MNEREQVGRRDEMKRQEGHVKDRRTAKHAMQQRQPQDRRGQGKEEDAIWLAASKEDSLDEERRQ